MDEFRKLWQNQEVEDVKVSMNEIRAKAAKFQRRIWRRNVREQLACLVVIVAFGVMCVKVPQTVPRVALALTVIGAIYVAWHIQIWGAPKSLPAEMGRANCAAFYRSELERQRNLLSSIWKWYLGPFIPGMALLLVYSITNAPSGRRLFPVVYSVAAAAFFWIVGWINQRAAKRLSRQISELDHELEHM